jgi:hypothetical protein
VNRTVKRIIALTALWLCAAFAIAQAPIGVCLNNVAQTISNGVIAPIPYATVALCSSGSTAANCVANKVNIYTTTALSTATPTNPFTADAGGNYYFCAAVGHYGVLISSSYGTYFVNDLALVDDWSKGGIMSGALTDTSGFIGPLTGNSSTANALASTPTACNPASYFAYGIASNGNALCNALPTPATIYYQTVQENGSALAQQPILNFDGTVVGSNGTGKTNVGLPNTGTAGTVTNPSSITTDAQGRVSAVSGNGTTRTCNANGCYIKFGDGTIEEWGTISCTTSTTPCTQNLPIAMTSQCKIVANDSGPRISSGQSAASAAATCTALSTFTVNPEPSGETWDWYAIGW